MKRALITGITGQTGSYLAELLLEKGYEVHGFIRKASTFPTERIDHVFDRLELHYADLSDPLPLVRLLSDTKPDEVYHLGAQSHVAVSFEQPVATGLHTGLATATMLEAIAASGLPCKFYQASSSEIFGGAQAPQNENSRMEPRSPYAAAKAYAFQMTRIYRQAYGLFAVNGILFNHECVTAETPVIIRRRGMIDIVPIEEVVPHREKPTLKKYTSEPSEMLEVWDRNGWTRVRTLTATWADAREVVSVQSRGAHFRVTPDHLVFCGDAGHEVPGGRLQRGDRLVLGDVCSAPQTTSLSDAEAWLLGALTADGWVAEDGKHAHVTKRDAEFRARVADMWVRVTGGTTTEGYASSGFQTDRRTPTVELHGAGEAYLRWLRRQLYTERALKRVPLRILNANTETQLAYLRGYNEGDGLKAGHGAYEFKSFTTNSPTLLAGLWWLAQVALKQRTVLCPVELRPDDAVQRNPAYRFNLNSPVRSGKGAHLVRPLDEVVSTETQAYTGWLFDLHTDSGTFHAGIGQGWIHNSPRRSPTFVTRKITQAIARIQAGKQDELRLGNLDACRDWGFAGDYAEAIWMMMQHEIADDWVIATGRSDSVSDFIESALWHAGLTNGDDRRAWRAKHLRVDERYKRPLEVDHLRGDATKAKALLGWQPKTSFNELVAMMVEHDMREARKS